MILDNEISLFSLNLEQAWGRACGSILDVMPLKVSVHLQYLTGSYEDFSEFPLGFWVQNPCIGYIYELFFSYIMLNATVKFVK